MKYAKKLSCQYSILLGFKFLFSFFRKNYNFFFNSFIEGDPLILQNHTENKKFPNLKFLLPKFMLIE